MFSSDKKNYTVNHSTKYKLNKHIMLTLVIAHVFCVQTDYRIRSIILHNAILSSTLKQPYNQR